MSQYTYIQALNKALREEMKKDPSVFLLGEDIGIWNGCFKVTQGLLDEFGPNRVIDSPLSESAIVGSGVGAALSGMRPVVEMMFMDFITCAMDQVINQAAKIRFMSGGKNKVPLVVRGPAGGGFSTGAQHSQSLESWFIHTPGLKVINPATAYDAYGLLKSAIRDDNPVIFFESKALYNTKSELPDEEFEIEIGKADIKRPGKDVSLITYGTAVPRSLSVAEDFAKEGVDIEVIDLRSLSPWDKDTVLESVKKTGRAVIAHEAVMQGGFGAEISSTICEQAFDYLEAPIARAGSLFAPAPFTQPLEKLFLLNNERIVDCIRSVL